MKAKSDIQPCGCADLCRERAIRSRFCLLTHSEVRELFETSVRRVSSWGNIAFNSAQIEDDIELSVGRLVGAARVALCVDFQDFQDVSVAIFSSQPLVRRE